VPAERGRGGGAGGGGADRRLTGTSLADLAAQVLAYRASLAGRPHHPVGALPVAALAALAQALCDGAAAQACGRDGLAGEALSLCLTAACAGQLVRAQPWAERRDAAFAALLAYPPGGVGVRLRAGLGGDLWPAGATGRPLSLLAGREDRVPDAVRLILWVLDEWADDAPDARRRRRLAGRSAVAVWAAHAQAGSAPADLGPTAGWAAALGGRYRRSAGPLLEAMRRGAADVAGTA
jgi:hypothetical protein